MAQINHRIPLFHNHARVRLVPTMLLTAFLLIPSITGSVLRPSPRDSSQSDRARKMEKNCLAKYND